MADKIMQFATALLLKEVQKGTESAFWQKISKSKLIGMLVVLSSVLAYALGQMNFEQASAGVSAGLGIVFLRQGQEGETGIVKEHLSAQDERLKQQDAVLDEILRELKRG